jgi:hypothetical protein
MHDVGFFVLELEVWDLHIPQCLEHTIENVVARGVPAGGSQLPADLAHRTENARAVEPLALAMFAEAHRSTFQSNNLNCRPRLP